MERRKPIRVRSAEPVGGFRLRLGFTDGSERIVDLETRLCGPVFEPIRRNPELFRLVRVENGTICWPNGADICPDVLYYDGPPPWARRHMEPPAL